MLRMLIVREKYEMLKRKNWIRRYSTSFWKKKLINIYIVLYQAWNACKTNLIKFYFSLNKYIKIEFH